MGLNVPEGRAPFVDAIGEGFGIRRSVFQFGMGRGAGSAGRQLAAELVAIRDRSTAKLRFGHVKLMLDGSIQGFTARLLASGYLGGQPNGMWNTTPEEFEAAFSAFHEAGLLIHVPCNGDEANELFLNTLEKVLTKHPRPERRRTITRSQLTT